MRINSCVAVLALMLSLNCSGLDNQASPVNSNDTAREARLRAVLLEADDLAGSAINVTVKQGTIELQGFVETHSQRSRAEDLMREHSDLADVSNRIEVK